jgi:hypothetical protein
MGSCYRYALPLKLDLDAAAQLARDLVLTHGRGANLYAKRGPHRSVRLHTQDAGTVDDGLRPGGITTQRSGSDFECLKRFFQRFLGSDRDVYESLGPVTTKIPDGAKIAIRKRNQRSASVAYHRAAQGETLDLAGGVQSLDHVADAILVLEDNLKASNEVSKQIASPKSQRQRGQPNDHNCRHNVDAELWKRHQDRNYPNHFAGCAVQSAGKCASLLLTRLSYARLRSGRPDQRIRPTANEAVYKQRQDNDYQEMESARNREAKPLGERARHHIRRERKYSIDCGARGFAERALQPTEQPAMYSSRRRIFVNGAAAVAAILLPWKINFAQDATQGQDPPISPNPRRENGPEDPSHSSLPAGASRKAVLEQHQKDIKKDIEKLYDLATQLKTEVEKTDATSVLSLGMVKKAEEIEKLAKQIKDHAKGS